MNRSLIITGLVALGTGVCIGAGAAHRLLREASRPAPTASFAASVAAPLAAPSRPVFTTVTATAVHHQTAPAASSEPAQARSDELVALESQLARLQAQLAARDSEIARLQEALAAAPRPRDNDERRREGDDAAPRRPRETDPARAAEIEQQRAAFRQRMNEQVADRTTFLKLLDTSRMTEEELANHQDLLNRIEQSWSIVTALQEGRRPTPEEREILRESMMGMGERFEVERRYVLRQTGLSLGYTDSEAEAFAAHMNDLYEVTSMPSPGAFFGGRGGPRGRPDGAPREAPARAD